MCQTCKTCCASCGNRFCFDCEQGECPVCHAGKRPAVRSKNVRRNHQDTVLGELHLSSINAVSLEESNNAPA